MTEEEKAKLDLLESKIASHDVDIEILKKRLKKLQDNISEVRDRRDGFKHG